jgi:hypothetical protein
MGFSVLAKVISAAIRINPTTALIIFFFMRSPIFVHKPSSRHDANRWVGSTSFGRDFIRFDLKLKAGKRMTAKNGSSFVLQDFFVL